MKVHEGTDVVVGQFKRTPLRIDHELEVATREAGRIADLGEVMARPKRSVRTTVALGDVLAVDWQTDRDNLVLTSFLSVHFEAGEAETGRFFRQVYPASVMILDASGTNANAIANGEDRATTAGLQFTRATDNGVRPWFDSPWVDVEWDVTGDSPTCAVTWWGADDMDYGE